MPFDVRLVVFLAFAAGFALVERAAVFFVVDLLVAISVAPERACFSERLSLYARRDKERLAISDGRMWARHFHP